MLVLFIRHCPLQQDQKKALWIRYEMLKIQTVTYVRRYQPTNEKLVLFFVESIKNYEL